jgi:tRNA(Ile)-lysidine synthase
VSVLARVAATIERESLLEPGARVLAMVSGGADSTLLLVLLHELGFGVRAFHVAHGLRDTSDGDEQACRRLCGSLAVPLTCVPGRVAPGSNLEERLRDARRAAAEAGADGARIATGHTASDRAETILYRLATSGGIMALPALPARDGARIRPLLDLTRGDVRAELARRDVPWRDDPSNDDPGPARNRIRATVLPALAALNPAAERNIARAGALAADERAVVDGLARGLLLADGALDLDAVAAEPAAVQRAAIRLAAHAVGIRPGYDDVEALRALGRAGRELRSLPGDAFAQRVGATLTFHLARP